MLHLHIDPHNVHEIYTRYQPLETQMAYYKSKFLLMVSQPNGNDGNWWCSKMGIAVTFYNVIHLFLFLSLYEFITLIIVLKSEVIWESEIQIMLYRWNSL